MIQRQLKRVRLVLLALALMVIGALAGSQQTPVQKTQKAADDASVAFAKENQNIWKNQPPLSYGWGVALGFGLGVVFTIVAQRAAKKTSVQRPPA